MTSGVEDEAPFRIEGGGGGTGLESTCRGFIPSFILRAFVSSIDKLSREEEDGGGGGGVPSGDLPRFLGDGDLILGGGGDHLPGEPFFLRAEGGGGVLGTSSEIDGAGGGEGVSNSITSSETVKN